MRGGRCKKMMFLCAFSVCIRSLHWCEMTWVCFPLHSNDHLEKKKKKKRKLGKKSERRPHNNYVQLSNFKHIYCISETLSSFSYIIKFLHINQSVKVALCWTPPFFFSLINICEKHSRSVSQQQRGVCKTVTSNPTV